MRDEIITLLQGLGFIALALLGSCIDSITEIALSSIGL